MNSRLLSLAPWAFFTAPVLLAQVAGEPTPPPPPVSQTMPAAAAPVPPATEQRVYAPRNEPLIPRADADAIVDRFHKAYVGEHALRVVVYVNRALVDAGSGLKLTAHTEHYENDGTATKTSGDNTYQTKDTPATPTLADQQTVREIERLVGRVFRNAGSQLVDQKTAASLLPDQPGVHLASDQAAKDRDALKNVADVAVEILISSRNLTVPEIAGDATYSVPDIQATAIRLKDTAILGQAAATDIVGKGLQAGRVMRQFDVRDITEATALVLMEDMLNGTK